MMFKNTISNINYLSGLYKFYIKLVRNIIDLEIYINL